MLFLYLLAIVAAILEWAAATFLAVTGSVFLVGAMILLSIGILGMYLGKTYMEVKKRPIYLAGETDESYRKSKTDKK